MEKQYSIAHLVDLAVHSGPVSPLQEENKLYTDKGDLKSTYGY